MTNKLKKKWIKCGFTKSDQKRRVMGGGNERERISQLLPKREKEKKNPMTNDHILDRL